jgi:hypothetical protein
MTTSEMQACLARLYVDDSFREVFMRWPEVALQGYELSAAEDRAVRDLDVKALQFFARSLRNKRLKRFRYAYPALFASSDPHVDRLSARYHQLCGDDGRFSIHEDILNFGRFVEQSAAADDILPSYIGDLVRYERHYYAASVEIVAASIDSACADLDEAPDLTARPVLHPGARVASFDHDVVSIEEALMGRGTPNDEASAGNGYTIVFRHRTPDARHSMVRINAATATVIEGCDGARTVADVVEEVQDRLGGASGLAGSIVETIGQLLVHGVLVLASPASPSGAHAPGRPVAVPMTDWIHDESF